MPAKITDADRPAHFWTYVDRRAQDECWVWRGGRTSFGHGVFWDGVRMDGAHRYAYTISKGTIPDGLFVRHACDNPACCNPSHLEVGTHAENMRDRDERGRTRAARGEKTGSAKLTANAVRELRERAASGEGYSALAREYGVTPPTVRMAVLRRKWAHVD